MRWIERIVVGVVIAAACVVLNGCARTHSPHDSTETGNPPVIDAERVALVVQDDAVHVVGSKGAVMPGGVTIHVKNLVSDKSANGRAAKDGSFDVKAPGHVTDGFSVQASSGDAKSKPVFVTQTSAVEGQGKDGSLSCDQQRMLASDEENAVVDAADTTCARDSDCTVAKTFGECAGEGCFDEIVSKAGAAQIEAAVSAIMHGVCAGYVEAGCPVPEGMCPSPALTARCQGGRCVAGPRGGVADAGDTGGDAGTLTCEQRLDAAAAPLVQAENDADRSCSVDADCMLAPFATDCFQSCSGAIVSTKGSMQVQDAIDAINASVCPGFHDDGCQVTSIDCPPAGTPVCKQGRCQANLTCDERSNTASAQLQQAVALADNSCSTNADCMIAPGSNDCFAGCPDIAISATGWTQVQDAIDAINAGVCAGFSDDGCTFVVPPCAPPASAMCNQGRCTPGPSCDDRLAAAQARLNQVAAAADTACTKDADCDYPTSVVECSLPCGGGAILSAKGRAQFDAAVAELNAGACKDFLADGCPMSGTTCTAPPAPICTQGQCAAAPAP